MSTRDAVHAWPRHLIGFIALLATACGGGGGGGGKGSSGINGDFGASTALLVQEALPAGQAGVDRLAGVATFGLPFPEKGVTLVDGRPALAVDGADVYQFRTLASWPDGSVKWALLDVQTDVLAGQTVEGLSVTAGTGASGGADIAQLADTEVTLNTGPLEARVRTDVFQLFDSVRVDGVLLVEGDSGGGIVGKTDQGLALSVGPGTVVTIEENGPARAVVRADGVLRDANSTDIVDFTCRITARAGSRDLEVTFTVRNANLARPRHTVIDGLGLAIHTTVAAGLGVVRVATHDGERVFLLGAAERAYLHQAYSSATTLGVLGGGPNYLPHITKLSSTEMAEEGYRLAHGTTVLHDFGDRDLYPARGWIDLAAGGRGVTLAARQMPYQWPMALEVHGDGTLTAGIFTERNGAPFTFAWRQHESRTVVFSFHTTDDQPDDVARRLDAPLTGRAADYLAYDQAGVFGYRLISVNDQNGVYASLGIPHQVAIVNQKLLVTRFLPAGMTGGDNNHASIERMLAGEWLRQGYGGQYLSGLDLALYKSEWQIQRSDGFHHDDDPGAANDSIPHSKAFASDDEHRYREGIIVAYYLTGDPRYRDALLDEAEILSSVAIWPHERSTYQSMRAEALVAEFTGDELLRQRLRQRVQFNSSQTLDVSTGADGWGWEAEPDVGTRRYYVFSSQSVGEKPPGENYVSRGFISGSLGPLGMYHAARCLGSGDDDGRLARGRLRDLAYWTREELYPFQPDPSQRWLAYSYAVQTEQITAWEAPFHPILLGMAEAYAETGDELYLQRGVEQLWSFASQDHGSFTNDLPNIESRLDVQHFLALYADWLDGQ